MALYDPERAVAVDPADAIAVAHAFVTRCKRWADEREIPTRLQRVAASHDPTDAAKLHAWVAYSAMLEHTLHELAEGTLDGWFTPPPVDTGSTVPGSAAKTP